PARLKLMARGVHAPAISRVFPVPDSFFESQFERSEAKAIHHKHQVLPELIDIAAAITFHGQPPGETKSIADFLTHAERVADDLANGKPFTAEAQVARTKQQREHRDTEQYRH